MGLRFRKSIKLGGGVRLNLNKKSAGLSVGGKGYRYSVNSSGRHTATVGIPGSGLSYTRTASLGSRGASRTGPARAAASAHPQPTVSSGAAGLPKPGMFAPSTEKRFYEGVQAYYKEDFPKALVAFEAASAKDSRNVSDDIFAGLVAIKVGQLAKAIEHFEQVVASDIELPDQLMRKYLPAQQVALHVAINITPRVSAPVPINSLGAALILTELYQEAGRQEEAIGVLQQLNDEFAEEPALKLSLCELLYEDDDDEGVVETAAGVVNDSDIGLACLHLKGKALARQGLTQAALETFASALKRTAKRDPELLKEIRYDRAALYEASGQTARARSDWEKLYAEDPKYGDVAIRVGVAKS